MESVRVVQCDEKGVRFTVNRGTLKLKLRKLVKAELTQQFSPSLSSRMGTFLY